MLAVMHSLRVKGLAEIDALVVSTGLPAAEVARVLESLRDEGLAQHRDGAVSGWGLTTAGRARAAELVASDLEGEAPAKARIDDGYRRFLPINREVLAACTDWQVREVGDSRVINDHADEGYDREVLDRVLALHGKAEPVLGDLADALPRFRTYSGRLANAVARVQAGEYDWLVQPGIDSFHSVWFELHEDLLTTLGIERSKEES
ncbi:MAG: transcriptional regulator [Actinomycetota bacterium]|nr:transcriptional regulator [Actinomycetota bacterium]